jgi:hypothetical protein
VDEHVRPCVTVVLREVEPDIASGYGDEPRETRLELVLRLFLEPEPLVPGNNARRVVDTQYQDDLLAHERRLEAARNAKDHSRGRAAIWASVHG